MSAVISPPKREATTLADLVEQLGNIPLSRIRTNPPLGTADMKDMIRVEDSEEQCCELIDGVLVEKAMGYLESMLAGVILTALNNFVRPQNLGIVLGADGTLNILPRQVRIPDVSFIAWERFPDGKPPQVPVPSIAPDLAVEVLSPGNTTGEMQRKLRDYFQAGVRLVWYADLKSRTVTVYTGVDQSLVLTVENTLDGGDVLPGFELPLVELFGEAEAD
jgi:Uma2 family endonuclease